ncbi:hypothetical protein BKA65DRAFT_489371 [Rhexocercosporidium sp. MPI-PUGE-AT-0058]|nr:hypothetical protein BKA65DRAFT_489371 [Rhexocercosporidium sp. MPI-PUGE-AT-0058]
MSATSIILLASVASVIFSHMMTSPGFLGSCSLIVWGSRNIRMLAGGGKMDSVDIARYLRDLSVCSRSVEKTGDRVEVLSEGLKERVGRVAGRR